MRVSWLFWSGSRW